MATITNSPKYGEGHQVVLKQASQLSSQLVTNLQKLGYTPGKSVFSITKTRPSTHTTINIGSGKDSIYLKDDRNNVVQFVGSASSINNSFNHYSDTSKGNTNTLTEVKELITMWQIQGIVEGNKFLTEDQIIEKLGPLKTYYTTLYYTSAIAQAESLKKNVSGSGYDYERQGKNKSQKIYELARKYTGKANDNWNPADVWMIKKNYDISKLYASTSIDELNTKIANAMKKKDILPISLKQVTGNSASFKLIDSAKTMNEAADLNFTFDKVDLSKSFNNFIIWTKSGFGVRAGFKASSTTLNVSLEGRFAGSGVQIGAVDAKQYAKHVQDVHRYTVRGSSSVSTQDYDTAKKELKKIFDKYGRISNTLANYKEAIEVFEAGDDLVKKRFANLISYLYSFVESSEKFEDHMKFCYFQSKKLTTDSCPYYLIS